MTLRKKVDIIRHLDCSKKENRKKLMNEFKKNKDIDDASQESLEKYVRKVCGGRNSHVQLSYIWCHKDFWTGTINVRHIHYGDVYAKTLKELFIKFVVIVNLERKSREI